MLGLTDNQLTTVMDTARQLPRLKFVALWGALTLTFDRALAVARRLHSETLGRGQASTPTLPVC